MLKRPSLQRKPMKRTKYAPLSKKRLKRKIEGTTRKRRKKGEIPKLKEKLWQLCRQIKSSTTCYTCGRENLSGSNRQLGHYIASSICSTELRYDLKNLEIQCYHCNINLSGATIRFGFNLERDHGKEFPLELWTRNEATKGRTYPKEWFAAKIQEYESLIKELRS